MQLSDKEKYFLFFFFFLNFLNLDSILNISLKKMTLIADVFFNLLNLKDVVRYMSQNSRFRGPFHKQHGKRSKTLMKSHR